MTSKPIFITGISTGIGKTITAAVLVEKLKADYWKPIQSGDLDHSDTDTVKSLIANETSFFYTEAYRLTQPYSPHKSADLDGIKISLADFELPVTTNQLVIEGAGGLMVPLNNHEYMIDLAAKFDAEIILVVQHYLGSINHTLLSIEAIRNRNLNLKGIIFNGDEDFYSEKAIKSFSDTQVLGRIPTMNLVNKRFISQHGGTLNL